MQRKIGITKEKKLLFLEPREMTEEPISKQIMYFVDLFSKYLNAINEQNIGVSLTI